MEAAANLLIANYRSVLIRCCYANVGKAIRFRADSVHDYRCYFAKVRSQHVKWRETGGALITFLNGNKEGPHDAILIAECQHALEPLVNAISNTSKVGVIYEPPTWKQHEDELVRRYANNPRKLAVRVAQLEAVKLFLPSLPEFTQAAIRDLSRAQAEASQSSSALVLPASAARSPHTPY